MKDRNDTIAALATPPGTAGLAVVRISGKDAILFAASVFKSSTMLTEVATHTAHFGSVLDASGGTIDDVVATVFRAPKSYTGEDTVEFSCHGGSLVSRKVLERCLHAGARSAEPGEFTQRAFLNDKLDLVQAEAIADLIHAQSEQAHVASLRQMEGALSKYVREMRDALLHVASMLELSLDFAEEDVDLWSEETLVAEVETARTKIEQTLSTYQQGRLVRDGIKVAIIGKPNAGKSSLLNALLNSERAIVTEIPGTTRDYLEEPAIIGGTMFRFVDTAGLRATEDLVESMGIEVSRKMIAESDLIICLIDGATAQEAATLDVERKAFLEAGVQEEDALFVLNKIDLLHDGTSLSADVISISAMHGTGLEGLQSALVETARSLLAPAKDADIVLTNMRHAQCMERGIEALIGAMDALKNGKTEEVVAFEVRNATDALGEIIGEVVTDDVLENIFSRFCIGK
ncbi:MAG: tRNA uridine-5-carboxymethylaminomethyl(34) synthesis GTPase MnmE [Ectothiorhodospiraceae bacterium]|nr:tRNA uridine-5-carboxymethylaminomethyl(34) synthesis GTPase MnmE [Ectothiorhodospiraceae bacterium]